MVRRLDDTRVGEYRNNWFFELIQLLISIVGCVALFIVPITYPTGVNDASVKPEGISAVEYLFNPGDSNIKILSIVLVAFFGLLLLNTFLILAIPKVNKSLYVKISKVIEVVMALGCFALLGYYMYKLISNASVLGESELKIMFVNVGAYICVLQIAIINSIFMYFNSKKVSIYD